MAYYAYKQVLDQLPEWIIAEMIDYEGDANYDGDQWEAAANYIDFLEQRIFELGGNLEPKGKEAVDDPTP
jgi:hypothetical protein